MTQPPPVYHPPVSDTARWLGHAGLLPFLLGALLVWVGLATFLAFWAGFVGWVLWQVIFASLDKATSNRSDEWGALHEWLEYLSPRERWWAVQGTFAFCVLVFLACLKLVPLG